MNGTIDAIQCQRGLALGASRREIQRTANPNRGVSRQTPTASGPTSANRQFQPLLAPTRHSQSAMAKEPPTSSNGLPSAPASHSFQPAAPNPANHQQTTELAAAP